MPKPRQVEREDVVLSWLGEVDDGTRRAIVDTWVAVTNAGGAVGFVAPIGADDVLGYAGRIFQRVESGLDDLLVAHVSGRLVGWVVLERDPRAISRHWRWVKRLQVLPSLQRGGIGGRLMTEVARRAREDLNLEFLVLTLRAGTGARELYERLGYVEIGRIARALRVAPGDDRDEIYMRLDLQ